MMIQLHLIKSCFEADTIYILLFHNLIVRIYMQYSDTTFLFKHCYLIIYVKYTTE